MASRITQRLLGPTATRRVSEILNGETIEDVCMWADEYRLTPEGLWTFPLHIALSPEGTCAFHNESCWAGLCVIAALEAFAKELDAPSQVPQDHALKFVIHFIEDMGNPIHMGWTEDMGGLLRLGTFLGQTTGLHTMWDSDLTSARHERVFNSSSKAYEAYLWSQLHGPWAGEAAGWRACSDRRGIPSCVRQWGDELAKAACDIVYTQPNGETVPYWFELGEDYYAGRAHLVDQLVVKAAVRLASVLEFMLG